MAISKETRFFLSKAEKIYAESQKVLSIISAAINGLLFVLKLFHLNFFATIFSWQLVSTKVSLSE